MWYTHAVYKLSTTRVKLIRIRVSLSKCALGPQRQVIERDVQETPMREARRCLIFSRLAVLERE